MGKGTEVAVGFADFQRRIQAMDGMLAKAELLAAQLESGEKLAADCARLSSPAMCRA